jgi:hypothetical protein
VIAENATGSSVVLGQGSVLKALRDLGYPALSRTDAAAVIIHAEGTGIAGFIRNHSALASKLLGDTATLVVSGALHVSPGIGLGIAAASAIFNKLTPDILAQLQQFEVSYDSDGLQNLLQLAPGQSAVGTVIFDSPGAGVTSKPASFSVSVPGAAIQ